MMGLPHNTQAVAAATALGLAGTAVCARALFAPRSSLFVRTIWRGDPADRRIAFTFDDGPWPGSTDIILDLLGQADVRATFFVIGRYALAHPKLMRRIHADGHLIGNHTFDHHRTGLFRGRRYWADQIERTDQAIAQTTGYTPRFFRPPMGFKSPMLAWAVRRNPHQIIAWSRRARDGVTTTPARIAMALRNLSPGDIVLLHDGRDPMSLRDLSAGGSTAAALPEVLTRLRLCHLNPVRVDELLMPPQRLRVPPNSCHHG